MTLGGASCPAGVDPGIDFPRRGAPGLAGPGRFDLLEQRETVAHVFVERRPNFLLHGPVVLARQRLERANDLRRHVCDPEACHGNPLLHSTWAKRRISGSSENGKRAASFPHAFRIPMRRSHATLVSLTSSFQSEPVIANRLSWWARCKMAKNGKARGGCGSSLAGPA